MVISGDKRRKMLEWEVVYNRRSGLDATSLSTDTVRCIERRYGFVTSSKTSIMMTIHRRIIRILYLHNI